MQALCRQLQVSTIDEIIALIALFRPGPMEWIPDYIRGKKDPSTVKFPHPLLEEVCHETYGVMVYQEQVMEAAKVIAGYTLGGADMLRRAMGKKDPVAMAEERGKFVAGAKRLHNIDEAVSDAIFDILNKFAGYGFNKSHSAAYAILSYQTAYLKANHPVQFMAAVLSSELGNSEKVAHFIDEALAMDIPVLGPDINESRESFTPVVDAKAATTALRSLGEGGPSAGGAGKIRFGLAGIKGVGEGAAQKIIGERETGGPYRDFDDFIHRVDGRAVNKRVLECLIKTGAFDYSGAARGELFAGLDAAVEFISARLSATAADEREKTAGQVFLFGEAETPAVRRRNGAAEESLQGGGAIGGTGDFSLSEQLQYEKELLGFYISGHPMNAYAGLAEALNTVPEDQLLDQPPQSEFRLCGIATGITKKLSRRDNRPWAAFTLATKRVSLPMNMFSDAYEEYAKHLVAETPVLVQGNLLAGNDGMRINVRECYPLDLAAPALIKKVTWLLHPDHPELTAFLRALRATVDASYGDTRLEFAFVPGDRIAPFAEASAGLGWKLTVPQFQQLRAHPAVAGVLVEAKRLQLKETRRRAWRG